MDTHVTYLVNSGQGKVAGAGIFCNTMRSGLLPMQQYALVLNVIDGS